MILGLSYFNLFVILAYFATLATIGWWVGRRQKSGEDFLMAGRGAGSILIPVSALAAGFSGISFIGTTGWVKTQGMIGLVGDSSIFIGMLFVALFIIPYFYHRRLTSIYEVLETRFNRSVRLALAAIFQVSKVAWLAGMLFAPALMFQTLTGVPILFWILFMAVTGAFVAVGGGLKSVMVADLVQFGIMLVAIVLVIINACALAGWQFGAIWDRAEELHLTTFVDPSVDPFKITTLYYMIGVIISTLGAGADQMTMQKYLSARSLRESQKSAFFYPMLVIPFVALFYFGAMLTIVYFSYHPELTRTIEKPDEYMPLFVKVAMPEKIIGLMIAAVMSATVSSVASCILGLATVTMEDFLGRFYVGKSPRYVLRHSRFFTFLWCVVGVCLTYFVFSAESIVNWILTVASLTSGVVLSVFLLAFYTKRITSSGMIIGMVFGFAATILGANYNFGTQDEPLKINFFLYAVIGLVATTLFAWLGTLLTAKMRHTSAPAMVAESNATPLAVDGTKSE